MKNKIIIIIISIIILLIGIFIVISYKNYNKIEDGYMVVFHGKNNETYIYKYNKNYKYINVEINNKKKKVTKKGTITKKEEVFEVAKKNNAYDYVTLVDKEEQYQIEDFKPLFEERKKNGKK